MALKAPKAAPTHPPYVDLVKVQSLYGQQCWNDAQNPSGDRTHLAAVLQEAIVSLKERNGSSQQAIRKYLADKHPNLPQGWEKVLSTQLKRLAQSGKLTKVCFGGALFTDLPWFAMIHYWHLSANVTCKLESFYLCQEASGSRNLYLDVSGL